MAVLGHMCPTWLRPGCGLGGATALVGSFVVSPIALLVSFAAFALGRNGRHTVQLWAHEAAVVDAITKTGFSSAFLPDLGIPDNVTATGDLKAALQGAEIVISVMPSHHCRSVFQKMDSALKP